jgi:hypothetical protein
LLLQAAAAAAVAAAAPVDTERHSAHLAAVQVLNLNQL